MKQFKKLLCFLLAVSLMMPATSAFGMEGQVALAAEASGAAEGVSAEGSTEATPASEEALILENSAKKVVLPKTQVTLKADDDFSEEIVLLKAGSISASDETVTENQPFAAGTAGSALFRIPCLITLENGSILAAADARYTEYRDFGGIDTIASVSSDGGKTWKYSFPINFPDSNGSAGFGQATTAIDPVLVQGNDGTIYCMADMNPTGVTTLDVYPGKGTGYITVDGVERLALTSSWDDSALEPKANADKYEYYVGDFADRYAPVLKVADHTATEYAVDEWYNIYTVRNGEYVADLTQTQVNSDTLIQQNAFYRDSILHVYKTGYIWLVTSKDNGISWEKPRILNPQIKRENGAETALLVSPGKGFVASDGTILVGCYDTAGGENAGMFYSSDNGETWNRTADITTTSSENEIVELPDGTLRMFHRTQTQRICYADFTKQEDGTYAISARQQLDFDVSSNCNVSAVLLKDKKINNKPVILVSLPSTPGNWNRNKGRIYVFTLNDDKTMNLEYAYAVNEGEFAYSCMVELENGNIGLLWEPGNNERSAIRYDEYELKYVLGEEIVRDLVLDVGATYTDAFIGDRDMTVTTEPDSNVANVEVVRTEDVTVPLYSHSGSKNAEEPIKSFQNNSNDSLLLENAEFEFIPSGDKYQIKNIVSGKYLANSDAKNMCQDSAVDMTVQKVVNEETGEVSYNIANGNRYMMFYLAQMNYNCHGGSGMTNTANTDYNLVLWEKKAEIEAGDIVPGYQRATQIEEGKSYLITALYEGRAILYYPELGSTNSQTKLVGTAEDIKTVVTNKIQIAAEGIGTTTAVVNHVTYNIQVKAPVIVSDAITATAGSQHATSGDNSASAAVDKNEDLIWHTNWSNAADKASRDTHWITVDLGEEYEVEALRYLSRKNGTNGIITEYVISYSLDNETFTEAATGTWAGASGTWYEAEFAPVRARYIKLQSVNAKSDKATEKYASAAEIQLRGLKAEELAEADYTAVNAAKEAAQAVDRSLYTEESLAVLDAAVAAVVEGKKADEQAVVDAMAKAITDAIVTLEIKKADYTAVDEALAKVPADLSIYTEETAKAVTDAVEAVERDLDITKQAEVDAFAKAIEDAVETLEEKVVVVEYQIIYVLKGGENHSGNPASYTNESDSITLQAPTKAGYKFVGWYIGDEEVTEIAKGRTGDITLTAKWKSETYKISYYKLSGGKNSTKNPTSYKITTTTIELKKPTRKGYDFVGWYSDSKFKKKVSKIDKGTTGDIKLYAKWKAKEYTIKYKLNGGKNSSRNPKKYTVETSKITLKSPTRKGYKFVGWYSNKSLTKKVTKISKGSTGNVTLYAKWKKK